jgi:hypothetical protein
LEHVGGKSESPSQNRTVNKKAASLRASAKQSTQSKVIKFIKSKVFRHCERSEAIQRKNRLATPSLHFVLDCFSPADTFAMTLFFTNFFCYFWLGLLDDPLCLDV